MRFLGIIALAIISFGLLGQPAFAEKRVALVMGKACHIVASVCADGAERLSTAN
jgi:hypothetical protein